MLAVERRNLILEKLQDEQKVVVSELSTLFDVSEETIRRDLDKLDKEGLATKSYGGAVLNENTSLDMPFNVRKKRNMQGKQLIAELVSGLVQEGEHIIVDPSTTAVSHCKGAENQEAPDGDHKLYRGPGGAVRRQRLGYYLYRGHAERKLSCPGGAQGNGCHRLLSCGQGDYIL